MHIYPRLYVCNKCGEELHWSSSVTISTPIVNFEGNKFAPICPKCWNQWLLDNFGPMQNTGRIEKDL